MTRKLNVRFLLWLLAIVAVFAGGVHFLHRAQAKGQVEFFLAQAKQAREKGENQREATFLNRYLLFRADDLPARVRLGELLVGSARNAESRLQAFLFLSQTLRKDPEQHEVRRQVVKLAMHPTLQSFDEALPHLEWLVARFPKDEKLRLDQAICHLAKRDLVRAEQALAVAIEAKPDYIDAYLFRADLLRQQNETKAAEALIGEMLKRNPRLPAAHLAAAAFWDQTDQPQKAEAALRTAHLIAPNELEVILAVARLTEQQAANLARERDPEKRKQAEAKWADARAKYELGIKLHADISTEEGVKSDPAAARRGLITELYRGLTGIEVRGGHLEEARKLLAAAREKLPEQVTLLFAEIDVLILQKKYDEATEKLTAFRAVEVSPETDYHLARIAAGKGDWLGTTTILEKSLPDLAGYPTLARQAALLLGRAWQQLFQYDRASAAYRRAIPSDPRESLWVEATVALAECVAELGQNREAIELYQLVASRHYQVYAPLARLQIFEMLRLPEKNRNWDLVDQTLSLAPPGLEAELLRSDVLVLRRQTDAARQKLAELRSKHPESPFPWVALALLEGGAGSPEKATPIFAEAIGLLGDRIEFREARVRLLAKGPRAEAVLREITSDLGRFAPAERSRLLQAVARKAAEVEAGALAKEVWARLGEEFPNHLGILLTRFELALNEPDPPGAEQLLRSIQRLDGAGGTLSQACAAFHLIWKAQRKEPADLDEATRLLNAVDRKRPNWSRVPAGLGVISDLRKQPEQAMKHYQSAVDLGDRNPGVLRRLIELYYERRRFVEVERILNAIPGVAEIAGLRQIVAEVSVNARNFDRALDLAGRAVSKDSDKPDDLLWLARMYYLTGKRDEAEGLLRKAVKLAPRLPAVWITLTQFLVNQQRLDEAAKTIEESKQFLDPAKNALVFAQCYELINRLDLARDLYAKLLKASPDDIPTMRAAASFYLRERQLDLAEEQLERILRTASRTEDDEKFARGLLGMVLAADLDYEKSRRALTILGLVDEKTLGEATQGLSMDELRARAVALSLQRDRRSRLAAVKLLQEVEVSRPLAPEDSFLLAQLQYRLGDWNAARVRLKRLCDSQPDNLFFAGYYAEGLLKNGSAEEARPLVERVVRAQPDAAFAVALDVRLKVGLGRKEQALVAAKAWIGQQPPRALAMATVFDELKAGAEAEALYRDFARDAKVPQAVLPLASHLGKSGRLEEAVRLLEGVVGKASPADVCGVAIEGLYASPGRSAEQVAKVQSWVGAALEKEPRSIQLLHQRAAVQNLVGQYDQAAQTYRTILELEPKNVLAYNNLAMLLALKERKAGDALELVRKAKKLVGPLPDLLDTEGTILIQTGDFARATEVLNEALGEIPTAAGYFHLAQSYVGQKLKDDAMIALREAKKLNLRSGDLHPLEQATFAEVSAQFPALGLSPGK